MNNEATQIDRVHSCARMGIRFHADPEQIKALSAEIAALTERAGEPVATPPAVAYVMGYVQGASDYTTDEIKTSELIRNANEAAAADGYPIPPTAPGASHE